MNFFRYESEVEIVAPSLGFVHAQLLYDGCLWTKAYWIRYCWMRQIKLLISCSSIQNDRLKSEQHYYIQHLLKQAKEFEKQLENAEVVDKEQVIVVMREKWATERTEKQSVVGE